MIRNIITAAVIVALIASGCASTKSTSHAGSSSATPSGTERTERPPAPPKSEFRRLAPDPGEDEWEIEHFNSLRQLVVRSDLVVVGTVTGGRWGEEYREAESDAPDDVMVARDLIYEVRVDHVIGGRAAERPGVVNAVMDLVDPPFELDPPIGEQAVFFLRRIGAPIPGVEPSSDPKLLAEDLYRPVSSLGVLDMDRGRLAFPMGGGADWAVHFLELDWDRAITKLMSLASG